MCLTSLFSTPSANSVVSAPPPPSDPTRAGEENRSSVNSSLEEQRRRRGTASTFLTGGLGDSSFGSNVQAPRVTALGKAA